MYQIDNLSRRRKGNEKIKQVVKINETLSVSGQCFGKGGQGRTISVGTIKRKNGLMHQRGSNIVQNYYYDFSNPSLALSALEAENITTKNRVASNTCVCRYAMSEAY